jgi:hypothetical protein
MFLLLHPYLVYSILFSFYFIFIAHFIYFILLSYDVYFLFNFHFDFYIFLLLILLFLIFPFPLLYDFYTEFRLFLIVFSTFFLLFLLGFCTFTLLFISFHFPSSCRRIPDILVFLPLFSPSRTRTYCDLVPIGCRHIARFPTPLCCPFSLLKAFFPTWNLDP